jgi:hypothetical protein
MTTHEHRNDTLYPRSLYRCDACGEVHGTRACNGAVNWQCPNEFQSGVPSCHKPAHQTYIGFSCYCCGGHILVGTAEFKAQYPSYAAAATAEFPN